MSDHRKGGTRDISAEVARHLAREAVPDTYETYFGGDMTACEESVRIAKAQLERAENNRCGGRLRVLVSPQSDEWWYGADCCDVIGELDLYVKHFIRSQYGIR